MQRKRVEEPFRFFKQMNVGSHSSRKHQVKLYFVRYQLTMLRQKHREWGQLCLMVKIPVKGWFNISHNFQVERAKGKKNKKF